LGKRKNSFVAGEGLKFERKGKLHPREIRYYEGDANAGKKTVCLGGGCGGEGGRGNRGRQGKAGYNLNSKKKNRGKRLWGTKKTV